MHTRLTSFALLGIDARRIDVEIDSTLAAENEPPIWTIVGMADTAIRESRERVRAALRNSGFAGKAVRITVNLAPADLRKEGSQYDLAIALGVLAATGNLEPGGAMTRLGFVGELGLDGDVKPVPGVLSAAVGARAAGLEGLVVPRDNAPEAAVVEGLAVYPVARLVEAVEFLRGRNDIAPWRADPATAPATAADALLDLTDVRGQETARRALEIAAAGSHCILLVGPPGSGKTMLARRLPGILPDMTFDESIETTKIHSIAGALPRGAGLARTRPFRAPHHTASHVALVGGGMIPRPGEVSLSHNGVLFLDEFPEFPRPVLEVLRQPLEDGVVHIARAQMTLKLPARFLLVAAMNPCPCGYAGHPDKQCVCNPITIQRYVGRISGPLLDRIDLHVTVAPVRIEDMSRRGGGEPSAAVRPRVNAARAIQTRRFAGRAGLHANAHMGSRDIAEFCPLEPAALALLERAMKGLNLSARAWDRIIKVARTIADLAASESITTQHISEAVHYRTLDRM